MGKIASLTAYESSLKIFGWIALGLGFIMNIIYSGLSYITINNIGISIVLLTIIIYTLMLPLTYKQQKFSRISRKMTPELNALRQKYQGRKDQQSQQAMLEEQREIYDKYGISPTGSCIQSFLSILVLFPLYRVIYNIPAYVDQVKQTLMPAVEGIMKSSTDYKALFDKTIADFGINLSNIGVSTPNISGLTDNTEIQNRIVDVLNKCTPENWDTLASAFNTAPIEQVHNSFSEINNFLWMNISNSPQYTITHANGSIGLIILAVLVPVLAGLTQLINVKMTPQTGAGEGMGNSMKIMMYTMPLISVFFCFTLPFGLGIYWISGALVRTVYQYFLNKHFDKISLDDIIEANREKAAKKKAKRGITQEKINAAARTNTRSLRTSSISEKEREELLTKAADIKKDAQPGSLAAKADIVRKFNEGIKD